jgi:oligopeptide/dipeptide ABC transporter ATP-binding protein
MGPSGCGKTTLLRIILGLIKPTAGSVDNTFANTGVVFQEPRLLPWRTALENVNLVLGDSKETLESAAGYLVQVGLGDAQDKLPRELSGGMQQRVALARALAIDADCLILDEPFKAMDESLRWQIIELVNKTQAAVLLITHNLGLVSRYSDFVNVMYAGEIVESGKVADVLSSPRHPYTSGLIAAVPRLDAPKDAPLSDIPGTVPPPWDWPKGCAFHPRCPHATEECSSDGFAVCRFCDSERKEHS